MTSANHTDEAGAGRRTVATVIVAIAGFLGILIAVAGIALIAIHTFARDDDGYYTTDTERLTSDRYAIASDAIDLGRDSVGFDADDLGATLKIDATSTAAKPVFIGIARRADLARYLRGVGYSRLDDFGDGSPRYSQVPGRRPRSRPSAEGFWVAQSSGAGEQKLEWDAASGTWTAVVMNADAGRGVAVEAEAGVKIGWLIWVGIGLTILGATIAGVSGYGIVRLTRRRRAAPPRGDPERA
jgi:hypothetical protein